MDVPVDAPGPDGATRPAAAFSFVVPTASSSSSSPIPSGAAPAAPAPAVHVNHTHVRPDSHILPSSVAAPSASMLRPRESESAAVSPPSSSSSVAGRKRKAASSTSLRGVANLTPDQLARKRANDRQAQRAIRERTKSQIEALEKRVRELSSQQPYQDLQKLVAEKDRILAENEDIRRRLATVMSILQPLVGSPGCNNKPPSAQPEATHPSPFTDRSHDTPLSVESAPLDAHDSTVENNNISPTQGMVRGGWQRIDAAGLVSPAITRPRQPYNGFGERLIMNFLVDNPSQIPKIDDIRKVSETPHAADTPSSMDFANTMADQPMAHTIPIRNVRPTCPLDSIFLDFLQRDLTDSSRQRLAYPSVSSLLNPAEDSPYSYSISKVFSDILRTFPDISSLPEQVGTLYIMFQLMRWQMYPTQQNYDRMPDWVTPRPAQLFTPHPAWIDYVMWPRARDRLVYSYRNYPFENWFVPYTRTISCNWPYEATDCLLHNTASDELLINPVFERHVRDLRNWSLGPEFAEAFPALADVVLIKPDGRDKKGR